MASYAARWHRLYPKTPPPTQDEFTDLINKGYVALDPVTGQLSLLMRSVNSSWVGGGVLG